MRSVGGLAGPGRWSTASCRGAHAPTEANSSKLMISRHSAPIGDAHAKYGKVCPLTEPICQAQPVPLASISLSPTVAAPSRQVTEVVEALSGSIGDLRRTVNADGGVKVALLQSS